MASKYTVNVTLALTPETAKALDAMRGNKLRSAYLRGVAESHVLASKAVDPLERITTLYADLGRALEAAMPSEPQCPGYEQNMDYPANVFICRHCDVAQVDHG